LRKAAPARQYTPEERERALAILRRAKADRIWALKNLVRIKDETGKEIRFDPYSHQVEIIEAKHDPTIRTLVIGKYRKAGVSVALIADHVLDARFNRNHQTQILNKDDIDTGSMFNHAHFIAEHLPVELQGPMDKAGEKDLQYGDTKSLLRIGTAGASQQVAAKKGRGTDTHVLHCTEFRFFNYLADIIQGATNSIPMGGKLIYESTSNGPRGAGAALIANIRKNGIEERKGERWRLDDQVFLFLSAIRHPKYRRPVPIGFAINDHDEEERKEEERILAIGLDKGLPIDEIEGFLCFRRWKIRGFVLGEEGQGSKLSPAQQFKREFPVSFEDGEEAAGSNFFNSGIINAEVAYVEALDPYKLVKSITRQPGGRPVLGPPSEKNRVTIWAAPELGYKNRYFAFADVGQGNPNSDFDSLYVLDRLKGEVVAAAHGLLGETHGVPLLLALAEYYDTAWLSWDTTGPGNEWRPRIKESRYPRILSRREGEDVFLNPEFMGLVWTEDNKRMACAMLRTRIEQKILRCYDLGLFKECLQFGFDDKGNGPQAAEGYNDDRVMSAAGLVWQASNLPACTLAEVKPQPFQQQNALEKRVKEARILAAQPQAAGGGNWD
jgi:hypothetical protein